MKRLFAAIDLEPDQDFLERFDQLRQSLQQCNIRWIDSRQFHLTVLFFGETPETKIPFIQTLLSDCIVSDSCFSVRLDKLGLFGSRYQPRVIWVGLDPFDLLSSLMVEYRKRLLNGGFPVDRQQAVPHMTLGRIKKIQDVRWFQTVFNKFSDLSSKPFTIA